MPAQPVISSVLQQEKKRRSGTEVGLTVSDRHHDPPHELGLLGIGVLPVQQHAGGADLARGAVEAVELVGGSDAVHHCPVLPQVRVDGHHLPQRNSKNSSRVTGINSCGAYPCRFTGV